MDAGGIFGGRRGTRFTELDLYAQYAFTRRFSVRGAVPNVFGAEPPVDMTTYGSAANLAYPRHASGGRGGPVLQPRRDLRVMTQTSSTASS